MYSFSWCFSPIPSHRPIFSPHTPCPYGYIENFTQMCICLPITYFPMSLRDEIELEWAPGLVGFVVSLMLFGCTIGQSVFYFWSFPQDLRSLKALVSFLLVIDVLHTIITVRIHWELSGLCHGTRTPFCPPKLPWEMVAAMFISYIMISMVQCFYAHRVWIISRRNVFLTFLIMATTLTQFALGLVYSYVALVTRSAMVISSTPWSPRSAIFGAICDILITGSVFFYLREGYREVRRSRNYLRHLMLVFINMGLLTCLISIGWCLLFVIRGASYFVALPTTFICKAYANSMMAVLNARRSVREREQDLIANGHNLATIDIK